MKKILITGITGQDGSYMAEYCLNLGHTVFGLMRRTTKPNTDNFQHLLSNDRFHPMLGDITDSTSINTIVQQTQPDYFINFAAQSFVQDSWKIPEETFNAGAVGVLKCLESVRNYQPNCRFYNAGSSEQFGDVLYSPQDEKHPFRPRSPYGAAKCAANHLVKVYRESYGIYAVQGLLFNHESERRGEQFVTRKITKGVARIKNALDLGLPFKTLELGNLDAKRDWSHAEDFVDGIWKMLNQPDYKDTGKTRNYSIKYVKEYVLASGETHTIRDFVTLAFKHAGIDGCWINGQSPNEIYNPMKDVFGAKKFHSTGGSVSPILVEVNPDFYRPAEVEILLGNSSLARKELGWQPKISFDNLVKRMVECDLNGIRKTEKAS